MTSNVRSEEIMREKRDSSKYSSITGLKQRFERALLNFQSHEQYLFQNDLGERTLEAKLSKYLQEEFEEFNVDCEYNRNLDEVKRLVRIKEYVKERRKNNMLTDFEESHGINVSPDIIVHIRGNNSNNKIIIEIKKDDSHIDDVKFDKAKIEAYKSELKYSLGIFLKIEKDKITKEYF